jgi:ubiquinone/menaquinone biosynthesis C-methylase UbiE
LKSFVRSLAATPLRALPFSSRRRLLQTVLTASATRQPADALRELLTFDTELSGQIDLAAMAYGDGVHVKHRLMRYHDFFVDRINAADRVLDLGCGYGAVAFSVATRTGATVVGLDASSANIAKAGERFRHEKLTWMCGEAPHVLPSGGFDVIVLSNVLEHIEQRPAFLRAVQEVCAPSRWLIRVPLFDRDWRPSLRRELGLFPFSDPTHFTEYTLPQFESELKEAGLRTIHLQVNWGEIWAEARPRDTAAA